MNYTPSLHQKSDTVSFPAERCAVMLIPLIWGIFTYGARALFVTVLTLIFAEAVYLVYSFVIKKDFSLYTALDVAASACVFAFAMPASVPYFIPVIGGILCALPSLWLFKGRKILQGGFAAVVIVRMIFGYFTSRTTEAFQPLSAWAFAPDGKALEDVITNTPLSLMAEGKISSGTIWAQFFGTISGNIGEISAFLLVLCGVFLIVRKKLRVIAPLVFVASLGLITLCFPTGDSEGIFYMLVSLFSGGAFLAAVFAFSDNLAMPITDMGKIVFAVGLTVITALLRYSGLAADGVCFAVTVMCLLVPVIDKFTLPVAYGRTKVKKKK